MLETGGDYGAQKSGAPLDLHFVTKAPVRHSFSLKPGDLLYPAGIRKHRLYLKNRGGHELGYLSFHDDRMYYIVVPLLDGESGIRRDCWNERKFPKQRNRKPTQSSASFMA